MTTIHKYEIGVTVPLSHEDKQDLVLFLKEIAEKHQRFPTFPPSNEPRESGGFVASKTGVEEIENVTHQAIQEAFGNYSDEDAHRVVGLHERKI